MHLSLKKLWIRLAMLWLVIGGGWMAEQARADEPTVGSANDTVLRSYLSANGFLNRGLYELAIDEYRAFLAEGSEHVKAPIARYGLAVCLFRTQQYEAAQAELKRLQSVSDFSYAAEVGTVLGQCDLALGRFDDAAQALQGVVTEHAKHDLADDAWALLAEARYRGGKYSGAIEAVRQLGRRFSDSSQRTRADLFGGLAEMALERYADAAERFEALLERESEGPLAEQATLLSAQCHTRDNTIEQAVRGYRKVLKQAGQRFVPDALLGLAGLLQGDDQSAEAGRLLDRLLKDFPESSLAGSARLMRGRLWFEGQRYERAELLFKQIADENPELADQACYWLGKCALRRGAYEAAAAMLAEAAKRFEHSDLLAEMRYDRAVALVQAKKLDAASQALEMFLVRHGDHVMAGDALHLLAATEHRRKAFDKSRSLCERFLKQYADHTLAGQVRLLLAENDFLAGQYERAVVGYRRYLADHAGSSEAGRAELRMGLALYQLERYQKAEPILAKQMDEAQTGAMADQVRLALGDMLFRRQAWREAEQQLAAYLSDGLDGVSSDDALMKLALCQQRLGRHADALGSYDRLLKRFEDTPHRLHALFERGQVLVAWDKPAPAKQAFEAVLAEGSDSRFAAYALNHLGAIATGLADYRDAADRFALVAKQTESGELVAQALYQQGQALMADGKFDQAKGVLGGFLETYGDHAQAGQAQARLAICLSRSETPGKALEAIERAESTAWNDLGESLQRALLYEKAWCLRELGRSKDAAASYALVLDSAAEGQPNVHAMLELAEIYAVGKRYEQAAKLLRGLTELAGWDSQAVPAEIREQAVYRLGVCRFELKDMDGAVGLFEQLLSEFPESSLVASASFFCGEAYSRLGKHQRAVQHLQRVVESYPSDDACGPAMLRLGEALATLQRWFRSEEVFGRYLERFADSELWFQAQFGVGWARENLGRYDEAVTAYRRVVNRHQGPTAARAQFQIGECLFAKKDYEQAIGELLKVDILYAQPQWSAAALYEAGRCFEALSQRGQAREQFQQVVGKYGQSRWAALAATQLAELARHSPRNP